MIRQSYNSPGSSSFKRSESLSSIPSIAIKASSKKCSSDFRTGFSDSFSFCFIAFSKITEVGMNSTKNFINTIY